MKYRRISGDDEIVLALDGRSNVEVGPLSQNERILILFLIFVFYNNYEK